MFRVYEDKLQSRGDVCYIYHRDRRVKGVAIFAYGFLSNPPKKDNSAVVNFVSEDYAVIVPHYKGTNDSSGRFEFDSCYKSILCAALLARKRFKGAPVFCVGRSLGGAAALVALAKSRSIRGVVALCPPVNLRKQAKYLRLLKQIWKVSGKGKWSISEKEWKKAISGRIKLNADDYADKLKEKDIMIIHGRKDRVVPIKYSREFCRRMKRCKMMETDDGHFNFQILGSEKIFKQVLEWMRMVGNK